MPPGPPLVEEIIKLDQSLRLNDLLAVVYSFRMDQVGRQLAGQNVAAIDGSADLLSGPFFFDDKPEVVPDLPPHDAACMVVQTAHIDVEIAHSKGFFVDNAFDFLELLPGSDGDEAQHKSVDDTRAGHEVEHQIVPLVRPAE